jgi:hypothetical protein
VLLMDGYTAHASDELTALLRSHQIIPVFSPPQTSDQTQPLDLGVFASLKRADMQRIAIQDVSRQTAHVIRILDSWQRAGLPRVIVSAFRAAGLVPSIGPDNRSYLKIEGSVATRVRHWSSAPHLEEGIGPAGKRRERL